MQHFLVLFMNELNQILSIIIINSPEPKAHKVSL